MWEAFLHVNKKCFNSGFLKFNWPWSCETKFFYSCSLNMECFTSHFKSTIGLSIVRFNATMWDTSCLSWMILSWGLSNWRNLDTGCYMIKNLLKQFDPKRSDRLGLDMRICWFVNRKWFASFVTLTSMPCTPRCQVYFWVNFSSLLTGEEHEQIFCLFFSVGLCVWMQFWILLRPLHAHTLDVECSKCINRVLRNKIFMQERNLADLCTFSTFSHG